MGKQIKRIWRGFLVMTKYSHATAIRIAEIFRDLQQFEEFDIVFDKSLSKKDLKKLKKKQKKYAKKEKKRAKKVEKKKLKEKKKYAEKLHKEQKKLAKKQKKAKK